MNIHIRETAFEEKIVLIKHTPETFDQDDGEHKGLRIPLGKGAKIDRYSTAMNEEEWKNTGDGLQHMYAKVNLVLPLDTARWALELMRPLVAEDYYEVESYRDYKEKPFYKEFGWQVEKVTWFADRCEILLHNIH